MRDVRASTRLLGLVVLGVATLTMPAVAQSPSPAPAPEAGRPATPATVAGDDTVLVIGVAPGIDATPGAATTSIPRGDLERRAPEHLVQALEHLPGVSVVSEGHAAVPAIRGLARGRTLLLLDGARVTSERRVGASATFLDPLMVEAVDVARGAGAVAYGSDALGGVIAVRTRQTPAATPAYLRLTGQTGAGIPMWRTGASFGRGLGDGGLFIGAHARGAEDYEAPDGRVANSAWRDRGWMASLTQGLAGGRLAASLLWDTAEDVGRPRSNSSELRITAPSERSRRATSSWGRPHADGSGVLHVTAFYGRGTQRTEQEGWLTSSVRRIDRADQRAHDLQTRVVGSRLRGRTLVEGGVDLVGRLGLAVVDDVVLVDASGMADTTRTAAIDGARRVNAGTFVRATAPVTSRVSASAGLRADHVRTRSQGGAFGARATEHATWTGFASGSVRPAGALMVTAQVSRGFRDPTLSDRYLRGVSGRGRVTGNPELRPERSLQLDLAARYPHRAGEVAVYGYRYRIADLVERYAHGPDAFFFRNQGLAQLRGVEVESLFRLAHGISLALGGHLARGTTGEGTSLDDLAPPTLTVVARKRLGTRGFAQSRLWAFAADTRPGPSEVRAPGGLVLDVGAGWRLASALDIRVLVRNAGDASYYASPDPRWVAAPGRSVSVTATLGR